MTHINLERQKEIFDSHYDEISRWADRIFAWLLGFQWLLGIAIALWVSPTTWKGSQSQIHWHVYAAIFLGGFVAGFPILLIWSSPGRHFNRYVVAVAQMIFSILFIHLTGGRIETHFHIFGSLAFLAAYRDFRPLLLATTITALDHLVRGVFWPESVYGVLSANPLRALEHTAWVFFEDIILFVSIKNGLSTLKIIARQQAEVESTLEHVEDLIGKRTWELLESKRKIIDQQQALVATSKMSALGEMAGGIAHEINSPLAIMTLRLDQMDEALKDGKLETSDLQSNIDLLKRTTDRISVIVKGLRFFAREGGSMPYEKIKVSTVIEETLSFCRERFKNHGVMVKVSNDESLRTLMVDCRSVEISQVLLNLLNNANDAIETKTEKWIQIDVKDMGEQVEISVTDSGGGIPLEDQDRIMQPFFTTKELGKGTGLGLSISKGIVDGHGGRLFLDAACPNTRFVISIPKQQGARSAA